MRPCSTGSNSGRITNSKTAIAVYNRLIALLSANGNTILHRHRRCPNGNRCGRCYTSITANNNSTTIAIFLAAAVAILIWVVLNKTTFGYELKAVGLNKSAARYAGINEKKNIILSMAIAGALAGFGAGLFYLSNVGQWNPLNSTSLPAMGFNGISVALLASSNPIGTIFSALFISHISVGGSFLSTKYYPTEISDLISGIIIYLCAFSMLFRGKIHALLFKNADKTNVNAEPAAPAKSATEKEGK